MYLASQSHGERLQLADEPRIRRRPWRRHQHHVRVPAAAGCAQRHAVLPRCEFGQRAIRTLMLPPRSYEELHQTVKPMLEKWIGSPPGTLETTATCARALALVAQDCDCAPPPQRNMHGASGLRGRARSLATLTLPHGIAGTVCAATSVARCAAARPSTTLLCPDLRPNCPLSRTIDSGNKEIALPSTKWPVKHCREHTAEPESAS